VYGAKPWAGQLAGVSKRRAGRVCVVQRILFNIVIYVGSFSGGIQDEKRVNRIGVHP